KTPVASGATYSITVRSQPANPSQTCTVNRATGTVNNRDIDDVSVLCATNSYFISGTVSGLAGSVLVLQNNAGNDLAVSANGSFRFTQPVASGAFYNVTVRTQPNAPSQTCTVNQASSIVAGADVSDVRVICATNSYTAGGTVSGLAGSLTLQNNAANDLVVNANGTFQFTTPIASGAAYTVTVRSQPAGQTCTVANASATVTNANVTNIAVSCSTNSYTVGGTVSGLVGSLTLQNNAADDLAITADGSLTFATPVATGSPYNVTVRTQPAGQTCTVTNGSGTMGVANVTNVQVVCAANPSYIIGGTVSGLAGSGGSLVLQNNGGDDVAIAADGSFKFLTAITGGLSYSVTVKFQPRLIPGACSISNASGTVPGNVSNVTVNCTAAPAAPRFAYVTNASANSLSAYAIDNVSGALTKVADVAMGPNGFDSSSVVTDPARKFAYVVNPNNPSGGSISGYTIDPATGSLTAMPGSPFTAGVSAGSSVHPSGKFVYALNANAGEVKVFAIDSATGAPLVPGSTVATGAPPLSWAIAIDPTGRFAYVGNYHGNSVSAYTIDGATGKLTAIAGSPFATGGSVQAIAIDPSGRYIYVANWTSLRAYAIDPDSGVLTEVAGSPFVGGLNHQTLVIDPAGKFVYVVYYSDQKIGVYAIDAASGALTPVAGSPFASGPGYLKSFTLDPTGRFAYATSYILGPFAKRLFSYTIDPATGAISIGPEFNNVINAGAISAVGW
ncbi:MAG: beta-propeller fold lactonase family protein, partial [Rhodanobacter sp.]